MSGIYTLTSFAVGDRIELHPATTLWMRGLRYGEVMKIGHKVLLVRMDNGRITRVYPQNVYNIVGSWVRA